MRAEIADRVMAFSEHDQRQHGASCRCVPSRGLAAIRRTLAWVSQNGFNHEYDLSVADHIFAIFAGVTVAVSDTAWLEEYPKIIVTILVFISLTVIFIVLAINQRRFWPRLIFNLIAFFLAKLTFVSAMYMSAHDLAPQGRALSALPLGVIVWLTIREISVFALNLTRRNQTEGINSQRASSVSTDLIPNILPSTGPKDEAIGQEPLIMEGEVVDTDQGQLVLPQRSDLFWPALAFIKTGEKTSHEIENCLADLFSLGPDFLEPKYSSGIPVWRNLVSWVLVDLGHHKYDAIERVQSLPRPGGGTMGLYRLTERGAAMLLECH